MIRTCGKKVGVLGGEVVRGCVTEQSERAQGKKIYGQDHSEESLGNGKMGRERQRDKRKKC